MVLREFLYVDTEKVRSMLAQIEGGIAEEARETERRDKRTEAGVKGVGLHQQSWGSEEYVSKSFGDLIFPTLEEALTVDGLLTDISEDVASEETWTSGRLATEHPAGSIVRVSAPGALFDARYVATVLAGFSAAWTGLMDLESEISLRRPFLVRSLRGRRSRRCAAYPTWRTSLPTFLRWVKAKNS
jgi:hypothetical protein